jgi:signal transduction histidine kinase/CheY-like chemotaxis protein
MGEDRHIEDHVSRLRRQQGAIVALARRQSTLGSDLDAALREITWVASVTLRAGRTSVWVLTDGRQRLECLALYELDKDQHSSGVILQAADYPRYFAALETGLAIDAHDARNDPRTSEFRAGYLEPLGITSMMDAAIRDEGRVIGVVCHEHIGPAREWTPDEVGFAGAVADQAALALAAATRHRLEAERDRMQDQLLHVQKLESLGVLAGGLAHDFDNLLTVMRCNVAIAAGAMDAGHPAKKPLEAAMAAAERAAGLTRRLLTYSGNARVVVEPVDLGTQVTEIVDLVEASMAKSVVLEVAPIAALPAVRGDTSQIQQLIMNLVLNAAEAVGDGPGGVRVSVCETTLGEDEREELLFAEGLAPGRLVMLEVADDGPGIVPADLRRIFEPFYTTKGSGRGLGLASVAGIVRGHRAALGVEPGPGGTAFRVYFAAADVSELARRTSSPAPRPRGMVLVIDDEPAIATVAQQILADAGYAVAAASAVRDGIALFARYSGQVCAVLVDLSMPEMSGIEVVSELRRLRPDVPAVLMSGVDGPSATQKYVEQGIASFLQKPFTPEELLGRIAHVARPPEA